MNSHLPAGRLAGDLEALPRWQVRCGIVLATGTIAALDYMLPAADIAPLYMPIVCGSCWWLSAKEGYLFSVVAALLVALPQLHHLLAIETLAPALRIAIHIAPPLLLAAAITQFRRSYDRELYLGRRDRMTGTLNKEVFHRQCIKAIEEAGHSGLTLLLIILDLDDFKAVNSRDGHRAGDEVLRLFASGVLGILREEDLIGRIGGDEFSVLMRVPSIGKGKGYALDIHARLSAVLAKSRYPVTCSMGALLIPPDAPRDTSELMHAADQVMYRAKQTGKNAVEIARVRGVPAHKFHTTGAARRR